MCKTYVCNLQFSFKGIKGKLIQKRLEDIFIKERHIYCDTYNEMIDDLNKEWDTYFPDVDLHEPTWFKRYNQFIQSRVQDIFDKKGAGATVADKYASTMQYQLYDKYQDVFDIYDKIMAAIINND